MDFKSAVLARANENTAVADIIGGNAYWTQRNQGDPLPALVFHLISDIRPQHLKGFNPLRETHFQADCLSPSSPEATALSEAVIAALVPEATAHGIIFNRAHVDQVWSDGEQIETAFIHRTSVDLRVWWQLA